MTSFSVVNCFVPSFAVSGRTEGLVNPRMRPPSVVGP